MATERLTNILSHVSPSQSPIDKLTTKSPSDIVITLALRTSLTKSHRGAFKDTPLDGLLFKTLEQVVQRSCFPPHHVGDICLGNVRDGRATYMIRAAALAAGYPVPTCTSSVNRFCSSSLTATQHVANEVASGLIEVGVAIGAETLSQGNVRLERPFVEEIMEANGDAADCMQSMGQTSENVGREFEVSREQQDWYAVESYRRAEVAQREGWFGDEIAPVKVKVKGKDGREEEVLVEKDDVRYGTTYEGIAKLKPAFPEFGDRSHAGNSSQVTDGAAAIVLMKRSKAKELGVPVLAKYVGTAIEGLAPRIMGIGPALVIPKLLKQYNLEMNDIDVVEINEAFASMAVYCRDKLGLGWDRMNPRGGAIAIGHPFGCTGVRQIVTGLSECRRRKAKLLVTSMCMGTGMGMAGLFVNEVT
ncbi:uncharacterized protein LTR77_001058 [Saxophila tyrrhenica]|uniref:Uncharacterized protein n=1 Tax=Saxophila tyrrhenica TaxID=1690608 RepID=A0AAV9PMP1_9PEZI|nr:hypothetical protein LTR77_001058 [Saxophila tyrrhenica]